jgi:hypothetical protein
MADPTLAEIEEVLARRGVSSQGPASVTDRIISGGKAALAGAESGAVNTLAFPAEGLMLPGNMTRAISGQETVSPTTEARKAFNIPEEPKTGIEQSIYRFTEGAAPAMAFASPSFLAGPVVGSIATGTAGLVGGLSNVAAKGLFPESPLMQMLVGFSPGLFGTVASRVRSNVPNTGKASVSDETGTVLTAGQRTGNEDLLRQEADVARTAAGTPVFKEMILKQVASLQNYAKKIQSFTSASNLSPQEISGGVIKAVDQQNTSLVNQFRTANTVNFNNAKKTAGNEKIFGTDGLNSALDNQIAYYSSDQMPPDLRAVAARLQEVKLKMSKPEEPSMILNAQGKAATVSPEQNARLTIDELQKNLESWGKAASTGEFSIPGSTDNIFKGTTPGTVKGIARNVLKGFRDDLDSAIKDNIPGAKELKQARDGFKDGLNVLDQAAEVPIIKEFAKDWETSKDPIKALTRLQNMTATERPIIIDLLAKNKPEILSSLRNAGMQKIMDNSMIDAGTMDPAKFLTNMRNVLKEQPVKGGVTTKEFLFPSKEEQMRAMSLVSDLEKITQKASGPSEGLTANLQGISKDSSAAVFGWTAGKAVSVVQDIMNATAGATGSNAKIAWMMTNPEGQKMLKYLAQQKTTNKPLPQTYGDTLNFLTNNAIFGTVPNAAAQDMGVPAPASGGGMLTLDQIDAELKKRNSQKK